MIIIGIIILLFFIILAAIAIVMGVREDKKNK